MLQDVSNHHPAEPLLAQALRRSVTLMQEESQTLLTIMRAAEEKYPHLKGGERVLDGNDQRFEFVPVRTCEATVDFVESCGNLLAEELAKAPSAEAQEQLILEAMREVLDMTLLHQAHPRMALCYMATLELAFDEYAACGESKSPELKGMRNNVKFYKRICTDALEASEGILYNMQPQYGLDHGYYVPDPYSLAALRAAQTRPREVKEGDEPGNGGEYCEEAEQIFRDMLTPYASALPQQVSSDMLGLILRCTEKMSEFEQRYQRPRWNMAANDNDDERDVDASDLLGDPLLRRKVIPVLNTLFLECPEAGKDAQHAAEAALRLDELLIDQEKKYEQRTHSR